MQYCIIALVGSLIPFFIVSADKSVIVKNVNDLWISSENFTTMLQVSLNRSACCNVFSFGQSDVIENIFKEFVKVYPYDYLLNSWSYGCTGYFLISASIDRIVTEIKRVPTAISSTEVLIVVDGNVKNGSGLLNVSEYQNSNVNIVASNGLWVLSEFFLSSRVFTKVSSYEQMMHYQGILDLRGRQLQVSTFYKSPLCFLRTTVNETVEGIDEEFFVAKNQTELDGIELKLFMLIADRLNFTWRIRRPKNGVRYGKRNGTKWSGGLIGQIFHKEVDMAFGSIWIVLEQYPFVNMSHPWTQLSVKFLVPRPTPHRSFWALIKPLSPKVWCAILVTLIVQSIHVCTKAHIDSRIPKRFRSFTITWTELMGCLVGANAPRNIRGLKFQFQLWYILGILLVTAYSSHLAARLASLGFEQRIDTLRDFIEKNLTWGSEGLLPSFSLYFNANDRYASQFPSRYRKEMNATERHSKIANGNYAIVGRTLGATFIPDENVMNEDLAGFRVMKEETGTFSATFLVQPWLLRSVNKVMLRLLSAGLVKFHIDDVLHRRTKNAFREVMFEYNGSEGSPRVLDLTPLGVGFSILILGLSLSTFLFFLELKSGSNKRSMREVLLRIKRKRDISQDTVRKGKCGYLVLKQWKGKKCRFLLGKRN